MKKLLIYLPLALAMTDAPGQTQRDKTCWIAVAIERPYGEIHEIALNTNRMMARREAKAECEKKAGRCHVNDFHPRAWCVGIGVMGTAVEGDKTQLRAGVVAGATKERRLTENEIESFCRARKAPDECYSAIVVCPEDC